MAGLTISPVDLCLKYGKELAETCKAIRCADLQLTESVVRVEACLFRIELELQLLNKIQPLLQDGHQLNQQRILEILRMKLQIANTMLASLVKTTVLKDGDTTESVMKAKKLKYGIFRDGLKEAIDELETWHRIFEPSWYLMMGIPNREIDTQLHIIAQQTSEAASNTSVTAARQFRRAIFSEPEQNGPVMLPPGGLDAETIRPIPHSPVSIAFRASKPEQPVIIDPVTCVSVADVRGALSDIRNFAFRLKHSDPFKFGLLQCKGILREQYEEHTISPTGYSYILRLPSSHTYVESLRGRLMRGFNHAPASLTGRLTVAKELVAAVSYVHLLRFVHKNVRPESILLLRRGNDAHAETGGENDSSTVLVGFDVLRGEYGRTTRLCDNDWEKNLYRHPSRQGRMPNVDYEMRHDIYSVGVCLLEIGLWDPFVTYEEGGRGSRDLSGTPTPRLGNVIKAQFKQEGGSKLFQNPGETKYELLRLAKGPLKRQMGNIYSKVVQTCLTCLDEDNLDFNGADEFLDEDGLTVGSKYIEKVVIQLGEINI